MNTIDSITVTNIRYLQNSGSLRAFCDVDINGILIRDLRVIQQCGQHPWVSLPQVSYRKSDGGMAYKAIIELKKGLKDKVDTTVLAAWQSNSARS